MNLSNAGNSNQSIGEEVRPVQRRPTAITSNEDLSALPRNLLSLSPGLNDVPEYIGNDVSFILLSSSNFSFLLHYRPLQSSGPLRNLQLSFYGYIRIYLLHSTCSPSSFSDTQQYQIGFCKTISTLLIFLKFLM